MQEFWWNFWVASEVRQLTVPARRAALPSALRERLTRYWKNKVPDPQLAVDDNLMFQMKGEIPSSQIMY